MLSSQISQTIKITSCAIGRILKGLGISLYSFSREGMRDNVALLINYTVILQQCESHRRSRGRPKTRYGAGQN